MKKTFKRIWDIFTTVLVVLIVLIAVTLVVARVSGLRAFTVRSGSMTPTYRVGALIFVKSTDPFTVKEGDVITYLMDEDTVVTHRVVGIVPDDEDSAVLRFRTKGDANTSEDGTLVHSSNLIGEPVFSIPVLGFVANYIQHPPGTYVAIAFAVVIIALAFIPEKPEKKKSSENDASDEADPQ